jgi:hypothetical protein
MIKDHLKCKNGENIYFFDLDNTLFNTNIKVFIKNKHSNNKKELLDYEHWYNYNLDKNEELDFSLCKSSSFFAKNCKPIKNTIDMLNDIYINSSDRIIILTARSSFDDKDLFLKTLSSYNIPVYDKNRLYIENASDHSNIITDIFEKTPIKKRNIVIDYVEKNPDIKSYMMVEDQIENIKEFLRIPKLLGLPNTYSFRGLLVKNNNHYEWHTMYIDILSNSKE